MKDLESTFILNARRFVLEQLTRYIFKLRTLSPNRSKLFKFN